MTYDELLKQIHDKWHSNYERQDVFYIALRAIVEFHRPAWWNSRDTDIKDAYCYGCENRCGCYEGDILDYNKWETCPTLYTIREVLG